MATNTLGNVARVLSFQAWHYIRFTINWNDAAVATGTSIFPYLPAGAIIHDTQVIVDTAFNAGASNTITVGYNASSYNNIVQSGDVNVTVGGGKSTIVYRGGDLGKIAADQQIFYTYAQTGAAATAGKAYVIVMYSINNDL